MHLTPAAKDALQATTAADADAHTAATLLEQAADAADRAAEQWFAAATEVATGDPALSGNYRAHGGAARNVAAKRRATARAVRLH